MSRFFCTQAILLTPDSEYLFTNTEIAFFVYIFVLLNIYNTGETLKLIFIH
jgi:hypothetical protein